MEKYDDYDSNEVRCSDSDTSDVQSNDAQEHSYSVSNGYQSLGDGKGDDNIHNVVELDAIVGDRVVNINFINADEIRATEFGIVDEAFEFYYRYGKCKDFSIRNSDVRTRRPDGSKITVMRLFVYNKHGLREKKHLCRVDRKRYHRRLTRTNCPARIRVHYKANKDRYVVLVFEEVHNYELTLSRFMNLHPIYRETYEADRAQIDGLQSHGIRTCHIMGYIVAQKGGYAGYGFKKKDLYIYFDKKMCVTIKDGDVAGSLNYLNVKSSTDMTLYVEYAVNNDGRMKSLFWVDGAICLTIFVLAMWLRSTQYTRRTNTTTLW
ncbi:unnamed protein product [Lathyrus sativus]|nr:unnamed protein product [Lathyrus sativus]